MTNPPTVTTTATTPATTRVKQTHPSKPTSQTRCPPIVPSRQGQRAGASGRQHRQGHRPKTGVNKMKKWNGLKTMVDVAFVRMYFKLMPKMMSCLFSHLDPSTSRDALPKPHIPTSHPRRPHAGQEVPQNHGNRNQTPAHLHGNHHRHASHAAQKPTGSRRKRIQTTRSFSNDYGC